MVEERNMDGFRTAHRSEHGRLAECRITLGLTQKQVADKVNDDGTMGFELQDSIFKKFIARARKNYEDSQKSKEVIEKEVSVQESMMDFFSGFELGVDTLKTINGNEFSIN